MPTVTREIAFHDTDGVRHLVTRRWRTHECANQPICASQEALRWFRTRKRFKLDGAFRTINHAALVHVRPPKEG